eukprot:CAMPEP_0182864306 /NCGR_PEP_ID=MMETSP0034_2-20130328/7101_1 /TAXON_ID=156128 /ORGANISM="Nephroselmis pyriformis, Strain CCMP717" /LENGTH=108 /DNA_ID=CAMNT_0024996561 /DNA_START=19 /DNA_END=345 /DNA_ORIENTATION=+
MQGNVAKCDIFDEVNAKRVASSASTPVAAAATTSEKWTTAPLDPRFPTQNQARHCYTRYNEYYKCTGAKGDDAEECLFYKRCYKSLCPNDWVEKWEEQRENGTWHGKY